MLFRAVVCGVVVCGVVMFGALVFGGVVSMVVVCGGVMLGILVCGGWLPVARAAVCKVSDYAKGGGLAAVGGGGLGLWYASLWSWVPWCGGVGLWVKTPPIIPPPPATPTLRQLLKLRPRVCFYQVNF